MMAHDLDTRECLLRQSEPLINIGSTTHNLDTREYYLHQSNLSKKTPLLYIKTLHFKKILEIFLKRKMDK